MTRSVLSVVAVVALLTTVVVGVAVAGQPNQPPITTATATSARVEIAAQPATPSASLPTPRTARVVPTATVPPTATTVPTEVVLPEPQAGPTEEVTEVIEPGEVAVEDEQSAEEDLLAEDVAEVETATEAADEVVDEATAVIADDSRHLAGTTPELSADWDAAIHTLGGGVMGVVTHPSVNIRSAPSVDAPIVRLSYSWHPLAVYAVVAGEDGSGSDAWYLVGPDEYVAADFLEPLVAPEPEATFAGAWVDVNLSTGYAIAYLDDVPVYAAITAVGKPGFETPVGVHAIFARVENETLDAATVGIPEGDPEYYYYDNVLYTQYFAEGGFALHTNYWYEPWEFGGATSHGCVNLRERDAAWFWDFLGLGSVVSVHY